MRKPHPLYRLSLYLYPKSYRREYGGQMLQTLEDMLNDAATPRDRTVVWLRVTAEAPFSIVKENFNNLGEIDMSKIATISNKRLLVGSVILAVLIGGFILFSTTKPIVQLPAGMTMAEARKMPQTEKCTPNNASLKLTKTINDLMNNGTFTTHITDFPAGQYPNLLEIDAYTNTTVSGVLNYPAPLSRTYNFTVTKLDSHVDPVSGLTTESSYPDWEFTKFVGCHR